MRALSLFCALSIWTIPALAQTTASPSNGWPQELNAGGTRLVIYQPRAESWNDGQWQARSAVMVTQVAGKPPHFGIITVSARTREDSQHGTVTLENLEVVSGEFPSNPADQERLLAEIRKHVSEWPRTISADRLRADLGIKDGERASDAVSLRNSPAKIIFSPRRAVLIQVDGDPVFRPVEGTKYTRVINTPAMILQDTSDQRLYLDGETRWMTATSLDGPWSEAQPPPADLDKVKAQLSEANRGDEQNASPAQPQVGAKPNGPPGPPLPPAVYVTTVPADLIQTGGRPQFSPIPNTELTYVTNSQNDIFMYVPTQAYYTLLSGRWFTATLLRGPWNPVPESGLPADFSKIPADSPKASVLASVVGTSQAKEAVITNQVPQTAAVSRKQAKLNVVYDGDPQFKPITGTSLAYAVNTSTEVIQAQQGYYACRNAVWFTSQTPTGPWVVADNIPAEIYRIPASSPLYHLRYVRVYDATPDWVYFGYTPGYMGAYLWNGVVVYGTGWAYPAWYGRYYYGWPWTWGMGFRYGWWGGGWFWHPWGWGMGWYHPFWGARAWYGGWWGRGWAGNRVWARNNVNVYNRWGGATAVTHNAQTPGSAHKNQAQASAQKGANAGRTASAQTHGAGKNAAAGKNEAGGSHGGHPGGGGAHGGKAGGAHAGGARGGRR